MKYVVHLEPDKEYTTMLAGFQRGIKPYINKLPSLGPHCTVMSLYSSDEQGIMDKLAGIRLEPFRAVSGSMDMFNPDALVIRLERSPQILRLHNDVIGALSGLIDWKETPPLEGRYTYNMAESFERYGRAYYGEDYNPHVTVAHVTEPLLDKLDTGMFKGKGFDVKGFVLSRKEDAWKEIARF